MKRFLLYFLTVCFLLAAGCAPAQEADSPAQEAEPTVEPAIEPTEEPATEPASGPDADLAPAPDAGQGTEASASDIPDTPETPDTDFTALALEDIVTDAVEEPGVLPRIALDCPGAQAINGDVTAQFSQDAADPEYTVYYEASRTGDVVSILLVDRTPMNDVILYGVYNLALTTGLALTGEELLEQLDLTEEYVAGLECEKMGKLYTELYFQLAEQMGDFYQQMYDQTVAPDNADTGRVWIGPDGQLRSIGRIYALAGAEYYEYPISLGLYF